ncbi:hypothetical protein RI367_008533 [Sorochytrium milnesiophthora]
MFALLGVLVVLAAIAPLGVLAGDCNVHVVQSGEWCQKIADASHISLGQLQSYNQGLNCNAISPGQKLCVSPGTLPLPPPNGDGSCRVTSVQAGDWCQKIADGAGLTLAQLQQLNPGMDCGKIAPGDRLCVSRGNLPPPPLPQGNPDGTCKVSTVQSGDWCQKIANGAGVTLSQLQQLNPQLDCSKLFPGARLCVSTGRLPPPPLPDANPDGTCHSYVVQSGDTCATLPAKCNIPQESFNVANGGVKPNRRKKQNADGSCAWYRIKAGDTCAGIAASFDSTMDELNAWNAKKTWMWAGCASIQPDMKICLSPGTPALPDILPGLGCQSNCGMDAPPKKCDNKMSIRVGYYEGWATKRPCNAMAPDMINPYAYTHIHYAFGVITPDLTVGVAQPEDLDQIRTLTGMKRLNPSLKIVLSVGGWAFSNPGPTVHRFSDMTASAETRAKFINSVQAFLSEQNLDGIDFDWEYPRTPERNGRAGDTDNYLALVWELRRSVGTSKSISIAAPAGFWYLREFRIAEMAQELNYIVYMTYDMHGNWDYHIPSLGGYLNAHNNMTEIKSALNMIQKAGVPSDKVLMGIGFYGRSFKQADPDCEAPGCKFVDPGQVIPSLDNYQVTARPGDCTGAGGILSYSEIMLYVQQENYRSLWRDEAAATNILTYNDDEWVAYDDDVTLRIKLKAADDMCLGGIIVWAIDLDTPGGSLSGTLTDLGFTFDLVGGGFFIPDDFFTNLTKRVSEIAIARQLTPRWLYQLLLWGHIKMLEALNNGMTHMFKDAELAATKDINDERIRSLMAGDGRHFFTCQYDHVTNIKSVNNAPRDCPTSTEYNKQMPDRIQWNIQDEPGFFQLVNQRLGIPSSFLQRVSAELQYFITVCGPGFGGNGDPHHVGALPPSVAVHHPRTNLTKRGCGTQDGSWFWDGAYSANVQAEHNWFSQEAFDMYVRHAAEPVNKQLRDFQEGDDTAEDTHVDLVDAANFEQDISTKWGLTRQDLRETTIALEYYGCYSSGMLETDPGRWPPNPKVGADKFLKDSAGRVVHLKDLASSTDQNVDINTIQQAIASAVVLLSSGNHTQEMVSQYIAQVQKDFKDEEEKRLAASKAMLGIFLDVLVGAVMSVVLPGAGSLVAGAVDAFNVARTTVLGARVISAVEEAASFVAEVTRISDATEELAVMASDFGEIAPEWVKDTARFAQKAFDKLEEPLKCMAIFAADMTIDMPNPIEGSLTARGLHSQSRTRVPFAGFHHGPFRGLLQDSALFARAGRQSKARPDCFLDWSTDKNTGSVNAANFGKKSVAPKCKSNIRKGLKPVICANYDGTSLWKSVLANKIKLPEAGAPRCPGTGGAYLACDHVIELQEFRDAFFDKFKDVTDREKDAICDAWLEKPDPKDPNINEEFFETINGDSNLVYVDDQINSLKLKVMGENQIGEVTENVLEGTKAYLNDVKDLKTQTMESMDGILKDLEDKVMKKAELWGDKAAKDLLQAKFTAGRGAWQEVSTAEYLEAKWKKVKVTLVEPLSAAEQEKAVTDAKEKQRNATKEGTAKKRLAEDEGGAKKRKALAGEDEGCA